MDERVIGHAPRLHAVVPLLDPSTRAGKAAWIGRPMRLPAHPEATCLVDVDKICPAKAIDVCGTRRVPGCRAGTGSCRRGVMPLDRWDLVQAAGSLRPFEVRRLARQH